MNTSSITRASLLALVLVAATAPTLAAPDRSGTCVEAAVPGTVILPDGSVIEDGAIRICYVQSFSPVSGLHELTADGRPLGRFLSRRAVSEGIAEEGDALVVLRRLADGSLQLHAYAVRAGDRMVTYRLPATDAGARAAAARSAEPALATLLEERPEEFTFISALR